MGQVLINMAGAHIAIRLGARGPNHALVPPTRQSHLARRAPPHRR